MSGPPSPHFPQELFEAVRETLLDAPALHGGKADTVAQGDGDRHLKAAPVRPVVERRKAIAARIRGRQHQGASSIRAPPLDGPDPVVVTNRKRPARELHVECHAGVHVTVALPEESYVGHRLIQPGLGDRTHQNEVHVP